MLTLEVVFDYVWRHFISVYPVAATLRTDYGQPGENKVFIANQGLPFFAQKLPFPEQLFWGAWQGKKIPFLFPVPDGALLSEQAGTFNINTDIIAGAFSFLSGWQEYYSENCDRFGRFPYSESLQHKHDFVTLPVVNYYFDILRTALEKAYGIKLNKPIWGNKTFVTFLSHDVDRLETGWRIEGLRQLKKRNAIRFIKLVWDKLRGRDHWFNVETVARIVKRHGAVSTFFWLARRGKFQTHPNADYDLKEAKYQQLIDSLTREGFENGLHGSFGTSENLSQFQTEKGKIPDAVKGNRFHYLCYDPQKTPPVLAGSGLNYDCSLGFAEHFGFRNAYCFPFRPFDFLNHIPYPFLEIPLNLMDATLWHPNYLQVPAGEIAVTIWPMILEIEKFGGCFGMLWHNENFSLYNNKNGLAVFEQIMQELHAQGSAFKTGSEIAAFFQARI